MASEQTSQAPITTADVWDLKADPVRLETLADGWRGLGSKVRGAEEKITTAARAVFTAEDWTGATANAFNDYRKRLADDIDRAGTWADNVAQLLDQTATTLRVQQGLLDDERDKLKEVPSSANARGLTFRPANADQTGQVNGAIQTAEEIRRRVDTLLEDKRRDMDYYREQFDQIAEEWAYRANLPADPEPGQDDPQTSPDNPAGTTPDTPAETQPETETQPENQPENQAQPENQPETPAESQTEPAADTPSDAPGEIPGETPAAGGPQGTTVPVIGQSANTDHKIVAHTIWDL
ncbi:hypothetical protein [Nonomuraea sp. NPDC050643]|uniref:hypothetical protein n=1 Tax=Nonomuraea sp. NPDC050643 TaxID=3155660 RepID=UPI0033FC32F9